MNILSKCSCGEIHTKVPGDARPDIQNEVIVGYCFECKCESTIYVYKFDKRKVVEIMAGNIL